MEKKKETFQLHYTNDDKQNILQYAKSIIPQNWNIFLEYHNNNIEKRGVLNKFLLILDYEDERNHDSDGMVLGYRKAINRPQLHTSQLCCGVVH